MTTMIFLFLISARHGTERSCAIRASRAAASRAALSSGCEKRNPCANAGPAATTVSSRSRDRTRARFMAATEPPRVAGAPPRIAERLEEIHMNNHLAVGRRARRATVRKCHMPDAFHPAVAAWFSRSFAAPTEAQARGWPLIRSGRHVLIAAPTGSGKTLAAFLAAIDALVREGLAGGLSDQTSVVYVSPLKALSNDVQKNLAVPLAGIRDELAALGLPDVDIRTLVRTGDTPQHERASMRRRPPHIVVTTPESLYVLLGSESGRRMLATTRT